MENTKHLTTAGEDCILASLECLINSKLYYKTEVVLEALTGESSQAEVCRRHNISEDQVSKWKQHFLENAVSVFTATDQPSGKDAERIAHLERLVGRMETVAMDIPKKSIDFLGLTPSQQRRIVEKLRTKYSVRLLSKVLDFNRNLFYYHPKSDPSEAELREEIEQLALRYPKYGYRRITQLLVRMGYTVGYRRVARLMKEAHLCVSVKRVC